MKLLMKEHVITRVIRVSTSLDSNISAERGYNYDLIQHSENVILAMSRVTGLLDGA